MDNKAQGAFEYILLLAGILLIVILVVVILRGSIISSANNQIRSNVNTLTSLTNCSGPYNNLTSGMPNNTYVTCGGTNYTVS